MALFGPLGVACPAQRFDSYLAGAVYQHGPDEWWAVEDLNL
jgi:hypothetical protein